MSETTGWPMARTLATIYRIDRRSWLPEHNSPVVWFEVSAGHDARDYQAENYRAGFKLLAKFHTEAEAQAFIANLRSKAHGNL